MLKPVKTDLSLLFKFSFNFWTHLDDQRPPLQKKKENKTMNKPTFKQQMNRKRVTFCWKKDGVSLQHKFNKAHVNLY